MSTRLFDNLNFFLSRYVTFSPNVANFSGIRTVRVLRALRTISVLKGESTYF